MSKKYEKLNAAINTDPRMFQTESSSSFMMRKWKLKERNILHLRITDSSHIQNAYNFKQQIGQGSFGTVISVVDKQTNKDWAMKIINKNAGTDKLQTVMREIQILKMVDHPHIIYLDKVYESAKKIYLILERCYGELSTLHREKKLLSELETRKIIRDLASAVSYLHKNDIVHRDLKLENILISLNPDDIEDNLYIKITDFGLSIRMQGRSYKDMLTDYCGTLLYMAPEIITNHSYSQQCDVWAIGIIMYTLLSGRFPFYSFDDKELSEIICGENLSFSNFKISPEATHLLEKMLEKNPALRLTATEIMLHPWIIGKTMMQDDQANQNVLEMMRQWRSEIMLPTVSEYDWTSSASVHENPSIEINRRSLERHRQQMRMPITNIHFERGTDAAADNSSNVRQTSPTPLTGRRTKENAIRRPSDKKFQSPDDILQKERKVGRK